LHAVGYDLVDNVTAIDDADRSLSFTYDRLDRVETAATTGSPFQPDVTLVSGHDAVGNRTSLTQTRSAVTVNGQLDYGYDDLDRLTGATRPTVGAPDESFAYDPVGNRLRRDGQATGSLFDAANRPLEDEAFYCAYNANGDLASRTAKLAGACTGGVTGYTWDAEDRLVRIDFPGGTFAAYRYDGLGRRIEKDVDGTVTRYVYDGADILLEYDGADVLQARYTHGPGIDDPAIAERDLDASGSFEAAERVFYQTDGLGSATELSDAIGAVAGARAGQNRKRRWRRPASATRRPGPKGGGHHLLTKR